MTRLSSRTLVIGLIVLIPIAAVVWWLGSPLFLSTTVEEEFPFAGTALVPDGMTRTEVEQVMSGIAKVDQDMSEGMPSGMEGAEIVNSGALRDFDRFHRGSGVATIYRLADGSHILRLDDIQVTNGPDLHVILTPHPSPGNREDVSADGYVDLGKLKGNVGSQNYLIPPEVDVDAQSTMVIYCKPFHVIFSTAPLVA